MPGIAVNTQAFIEDFFTEFGLAPRRGVGTAAFIGAARIEVESDEVVCGLCFEDDGINSRLQGAWIFGIKRLLNGFPADARGIEFRNVKMVPKEESGTGAVGSPRGDRETHKARALVMEVAILRCEARSRAVRMMKTGPDDTLPLTGANYFVDRSGTL